MIRANLKGHSGLKGLLLKHGEKIGLAITGIVDEVAMETGPRRENPSARWDGGD